MPSFTVSDSLFSLLPSIFSHQIAPFPFHGGNGVTYTSSFCHLQFLGDLLSHPECLELLCFISGFRGVGSRLGGSLGAAMGRGLVGLGGDDLGMWWEELCPMNRKGNFLAPCSHFPICTSEAQAQAG